MEYGASRIGTTPQEAATNSVGGRAVQVNEDGRYAIVLVRGGNVEGSTDDLLVLTEHFRFGWQSIGNVYYLCDLRAFVVSQSVRSALLRGMADTHRDPGPCEPLGAELDRGAETDIESIRQAAASAIFLQNVNVAEKYALAQRFGSETLYQRRNGRWVPITGGGGALGSDDLASYGVPERLWCTLLPYGTPCVKAADSAVPRSTTR